MTEIRDTGSPGNRSRQPYLTLGEEFRAAVLALCEERDWTLRELSRQAYLDVGFLSKLVRGLTPPTVDVAKALDKAFGAGDTLLRLAKRLRTEPHPLLPVDRTFVGRGSQSTRLDAISEELTVRSPPTVVVIAGPAGVGKTSLAVHWANTQRSTFGIVLWSDLHGYTGDQSQQAKPSDILDDLLRGLGVPSNRIPVTESERLSLLRGHLRNRETKVLIVLDNAFDLAQVKSALPGTPGTLVLITSRRRIRGLALEARTVHVPVAPMDDGDSTSLVAALIGQERAHQEPEAVARLVNLCAALPLALTIAGNLIAADRGTSVQQHADALAERGRLHMLDGDDAGIGVRAAFSWSYESAAPEDARMFRLLGLHPGPRFSAAAAAALAGVTEHEALAILDRLAQAHLVQQRDGHYRFHDLLRDYAAAEIASARWDHERNEAVARLVHWYVHSCHAAVLTLMPARDHHEDIGDPPPEITPMTFDSYDDAFTWCAEEMPNVTPVAQLAVDHRLWRAAWRMPTDLIDYHVLARPWQVWTSSMQIALRAGEAEGNDLWIAEAADKLAAAHLRLRDYERSDELSRRALVLTEHRRPVPSRLGWPLINLGNSAHARGDFHAAVALIGQGVDAFVAGGSRIGELTGRIEWGRALRAVGDQGRALQQGRLAVDGFRADGDLHGVGSALVPLARTCRAFGQHDQALDYSDEAVKCFQDVSDEWGETDALEVKGLVLDDLGRRDEAVQCLTTAMHLVQALDEVKADGLRQAIATLGSFGDRT